MPAHAERGSKQVFLATDGAPRAAEMWRAQLDLLTDPGRGDRALKRLVAAGQTSLGGRVFRVPDCQLGALERYIERLDRRAGRLRTNPIRLADTGERDAHGRFVVLNGEPPRLAGWTVVAIVSHREQPSTLRPVAAAGTGLDPAVFATGDCEHCGLRRQRAETFVVSHHATGEIRQVGSGCLRDFVGGHDPERACQRAELLALAHGSLADADHASQALATTRAPGRASHTPPVAVHRHAGDNDDVSPIDEFAAHAAHTIRAHGWVSRDRARRTGAGASADRALASLQHDAGVPTAADHALAEGALGWARALWATKPSPSTCEKDAVAAVSDAVAGPRGRGLVCAVIAIYRRQRARSQHVAAVGAQISLTVLVERTSPQQSRRHPGLARHDLLDAEANRYAWWQTQGAPLKPGQVVTLRARVTRHATFHGQAVTVLSDCQAIPRKSREPSAARGGTS